MAPKPDSKLAACKAAECRMAAAQAATAAAEAAGQGPPSELPMRSAAAAGGCLLRFCCLDCQPLSPLSPPHPLSTPAATLIGASNQSVERLLHRGAKRKARATGGSLPPATPSGLAGTVLPGLPGMRAQAPVGACGVAAQVDRDASDAEDGGGRQQQQGQQGQQGPWQGVNRRAARVKKPARGNGQK